VRVADRRGFEPADEEGADGEEDDTDPVLDKGIERLLTPPGAEGAEPAEEEAAA
jgi:hypothetical protein